ncbi:MAG: glycoside hydrolase family 28 protein [Prevotellaceae bacterium]|nr:glycoside hydrolase family 28 protein [Prevotellaceae bacterium]
MKRTILTLITCLLALSPALSQNEWNTVYKEIEARIKAPEFKDRTYKAAVKPQYAAAKNQKIINATIRKCAKAGGGKVVIPAGKYSTGPVTLLSDVNLCVEKGAELVFAFDRTLYPLVYTRWEGLDLWNYQPCIYAIDCRNVALTGEGTINGNGNDDGNWWYMKGLKRHGYHEGVDEWQGTAKVGPRAELIKMSDNNVPVSERKFGMGKGLRPQLVNFVRCENVLIEDVKLLNSPFWVIHPVFCRNMTVRGVHVYNNGPNGDGCDPESCEDVLIENCTFNTGDDCIALKSGRNGDGLRAAAPCRNIIVRKCRMADGHGGVVIGSEISGGCDNVFAEDCDMDSPNLDRVLRIKTNTCRGGVNQNIFMRNIRVGQCREAVMRINLMYEPNEIAERGHIPTVRNVYMENVTCGKSKYGILINGLDDQSQIYNINVRNCRFGGLSAEPVYRTGKSHGINIENLTVSAKL